MSVESQTTELAQLLAEVEIPATPEQIELLDQYRRLLWSWNERMNLTRHTTLEKFVTRDLVDSWQLCKLIEPGERVLDVGTGGGVPGVVMAILRPDLTVTLAESTQKKAAAVGEMVAELGLEITVHACRAQDVLEMQTFDTLVARAVAPLEKVLRWFADYWDAFDRLLLIKGRSWVDERSEAKRDGLLKRLQLRKASEYLTPRSDAQSVILKLWQSGSENEA